MSSDSDEHQSQQSLNYKPTDSSILDINAGQIDYHTVEKLHTYNQKYTPEVYIHIFSTTISSI
jgi:hypothetical protein